jgi:hypothetical protein
MESTLNKIKKTANIPLVRDREGRGFLIIRIKSDLVAFTIAVRYRFPAPQHSVMGTADKAADFMG